MKYVTLAVLLAVTLCLSCNEATDQAQEDASPTSETSAQQSEFVGRWDATDGKATVSLILQNDHTCAFNLSGMTTQGTWSVSGNDLTVTIPSSGSMGGATFHGILKTQSNELEIWEGEGEHIIAKRVLEPKEMGQ